MVTPAHSFHLAKGSELSGSMTSVDRHRELVLRRAAVLGRRAVLGARSADDVRYNLVLRGGLVSVIGPAEEEARQRTSTHAVPTSRGPSVPSS